MKVHSLENDWSQPLSKMQYLWTFKFFSRISQVRRLSVYDRIQFQNDKVNRKGYYLIYESTRLSHKDNYPNFITDLSDAKNSNFLAII